MFAQSRHGDYSAAMRSMFKVAILLLALAVVFVFFVSQDSEFTIKWKTVQLGESSQSVRNKLGDPYKNQEKFSFWIMEPHQNEALDSGAIYFITWIDGIDTLYIAGFDEDDEVVYKIYGGS